MESNDPRQRQTNTQGYPGQPGQPALLQQPPQYPPVSASDRFRPPTVQQSPTSAPSARRGTGQQYGTYGYGASQQFVGSSIQGSALQYSHEYTQESSRGQQQQQQQPHSYTQYGPGLMYNVPGQQATTSPTSPYEPVQPYQQPPRQSAAIEVLSSQFGVPQQYYVPPPGDSGPANAPQAPLAPQSVPSQYGPISYTQQSPVGQPREPLGPAYGSNLSDPSAAHGTSAQYGNQDYASQDAAEFDAAYSQYQSELRRTNESVRDGRLSEAGSSLLNISEWLLGNAENLGLVRDDETVHADRLRLWEDFNNCWLVTLHKQKDMCHEALRSGRTPGQPQSLMDAGMLQNMGDELVRLCDAMEKHGLVDYQMGVWEESITDLLLKCIDQVEEQGGPSTRASSGVTTARRR